MITYINTTFENLQQLSESSSSEKVPQIKLKLIELELYSSYFSCFKKIITEKINEMLINIKN